MARTAERGLLTGAVRYALSAALLVTPRRLPLPTPCAGWDLRRLLYHLGDSMDALSEGLYTGFVHPDAAAGGDRSGSGGPGGPVAVLSQCAGTLLCASAAAGSAERRVAVGDRELTAGLITLTGAVEIAVHGWDISVTCGGTGTIPSALASDLLPVAALLAPRGTRAGLFADPVPVAETAGPGDRLVAFLGRHPRRAR